MCMYSPYVTSVVQPLVWNNVCKIARLNSNKSAVDSVVSQKAIEPGKDTNQPRVIANHLMPGSGFETRNIGRDES